MSTWDESKELAQSALDDTNFIDEVQDKYMDSIEGKMNAAKASIQDFWNTFISAGNIADIVGAFGSITGAIDGMLKVAQKLPLVGNTTTKVLTGLIGITGSGLINSFTRARNKLAADPDLKGNYGVYDVLRKTKETFVEDFKTLGVKETVEGRENGLFSIFKNAFKDYKVNANEAVQANNQLGSSLSGLNNNWNATKNAVSATWKSMTGFSKVLTGITAAMMGFELVSKVIDYYSASVKKAKDAVGKASSVYKNQTSTLKKNKDTVSSLKDEWSNLSKGVNTSTNENVSLTSSEYERYLELNKQISDIIPETISGYDAQGNAILKVKGNVESLNAALEKQQVLQANNRIVNNADAYENLARHISGQTSGWEQFSTSWDQGLPKFLGLQEKTSNDLADQLGNQKAIDFINKISKYKKKDFNKIAELLSDKGGEGTSLEGDYLESIIKKVKDENGKSISVKSYADWKKILNSGELEKELNKQQQVVKANADTNKQLLNDYITTFTKGDGEFSNLSEEVSNNIATLLTKVDNDTITELTANGGLEKFARDYFSKISKSKDAQNALSNLLGIGKEDDITKIQSILKNDLTTLSKTLGVDKKTLELQLDLKGANEAVAKVEDVYENTKKLAKKQKDGVKASKKEAEYKKKIGKYIKDNALHTADQLELLDQCVQDAQTLEEAFRQYDTQKYTVEVDMNSLDDLKANLTTVKEEIEAINQAKTDSNSSSGMTLDDIQKVKDAYSSVEGIDYDYSKLFEQTYSGMHLNQQELSKLQSQYEKVEYDKYTGKVENLQEKYQGLCADIARTGDAQDKYNKIQERDNVLEQIQQAKEYQSVFEGMTNSVTKWQQAQSYSLTQDIGSGYEEAKKLFDEGWIGDEKFQAYAQLFTNQNLAGSTSDVYKQVFAQNEGRMQRYFAEGRQGVINFSQDLVTAMSPGRNLLDEDNNIIWDNMPDMDTIAKTMNLDRSLVEAMFKEMNRAGADLDFSEAADNLRSMREEAVQAGQAFDSLDKLDTDKKLINSDKLSQEQKDFTFNLDATGDALNTQIKNAQSLRKALVEAYGEGSEQVKAFDKQLDYLLAKKGSEESKTTWEDVSNGQNTLNSALKRSDSKYSFDIDWSSEDLSYYQGQIENLDKALTETDKDGNLKVKMDDSELQSTLALVDQLQQKEWELSNNNVSAHVNTSNEKVTGNQKTMIEEFDQIQNAANHLQNLNQKKKMGFAVDKQELADAKKNLTDYVNAFVAAHKETSNAMGLKKTKEKDANKTAKKVTSKQAGDYLSEMGVDKSAWKNTSKTKSTGGGGSTKKSITVAIKGENKIDKLKEKMASVENKKAKVTVTTPGSKKVTNLKKNIDEVSGTTAEAQVTAKVSGGGKVKNLKQNVEAIDGKTASAQVTATTSGTKKVHNLRNAISQVKSKQVSEQASVSGLKKVQNLAAAIASLHSKTINITTNYTENHSKKHNGDGDFNGTAHASGTAFANGSWGARKSGLSLVGELGRKCFAT